MLAYYKSRFIESEWKVSERNNFIVCFTHQCDQMARLIVQYLAT